MAKKLTAKEKKRKAQDLIMRQIAKIGYGSDYEDFVSLIGDMEKADAILMTQMNRIAKMFGFESAWFG